MNDFRGDLTDISAEKGLRATRHEPRVDLTEEWQQCFIFSRNIGKVTPKKIYFHYLNKYFLDQSIQKNIFFNFEKGSTEWHVYRLPWVLSL